MPLRHCAACGREGEKNSFFRVVRLPDRCFFLDTAGNTDGRGAYLCRSRVCVERAIRRQSLHRSFRQAVPQEIYEELAEKLSDE